MKGALLAVLSAQTTSVSAFTLTTPNIRSVASKVQAATATSAMDADVQVKTEVPVTRVSVCAGELCQCQGEQYEYTGGASDAAIEQLEGLGLPFPVDEVGCLGACGMGTMIAIDFENGDSIMTDGLESTLLELGISPQTAPPADAVSVDESETIEIVNAVEDVVGNDEVATSATPPVMASVSKSSTEVKQKKEKPPIMADARDRMRQEAVEKVENPWLNMAGYLAQKATDKMFGGSS